MQVLPKLNSDAFYQPWVVHSGSAMCLVLILPLPVSPSAVSGCCLQIVRQAIEEFGLTIGFDALAERVRSVSSSQRPSSEVCPTSFRPRLGLTFHCVSSASTGNEGPRRCSPIQQSCLGVGIRMHMHTCTKGAMIHGLCLPLHPPLPPPHSLSLPCAVHATVTLTS